MDLPLEAHLDLTWRQLPGSLCERVGTRGPCLRLLSSGIGIPLDREIFTRLTHSEYSDESESVCRPCWGPKPVNSDYISCGPFKPIDDGRSASCDSPPVPPGLPSTPQSSCQPYTDANASKGCWVFRKHVLRKSNEKAADVPVVVEPLDVPASSEPVVPEVIHPVQYGITPIRLALPHSDDEILTGIDGTIRPETNSNDFGVFGIN